MSLAQDPTADEPIDPGGFTPLPFLSADPRLEVLRHVLRVTGLTRGVLRYGASTNPEGCKVSARLDVAALTALALDGLPETSEGRVRYARRLLSYLTRLSERGNALSFALHRAWADAETPEEELAATRALLPGCEDQP